MGEFVIVFILILVSSLLVSICIVFAILAIQWKNDEYYSKDNIPDEPITCYVKERRK